MTSELNNWPNSAPGNHTFSIRNNNSYTCYKCGIRVSAVFTMYSKDNFWRATCDKTKPMPTCAEERMRQVLE